LTPSARRQSIARWTKPLQGDLHGQRGRNCGTKAQGAPLAVDDDAAVAPEAEALVVLADELALVLAEMLVLLLAALVRDCARTSFKRSFQTDRERGLTDDARHVPRKDRRHEHLVALGELLRELDDRPLVGEDVLGASAAVAERCTTSSESVRARE
jgi:hypothetical protein